MSRWFFIGLALATTLGTLGTWSCTQADVERCQRDEDCESGLVCCKGSVAEPTDDGICKRADESCASSPTDGGGDTSREDARAEADATAEAEAVDDVVDDVVDEAEAEAVDEADADETLEAVEDVPDEILDALPETDA